MSRLTTEQKVANSIVRGLNVLDINVRLTAGLIAQAGPQIQVRMFQLFMRLVEIWSDRYDAGEFSGTDEYSNVVINSKRIMEIMDRYRT